MNKHSTSSGIAGLGRSFLSILGLVLVYRVGSYVVAPFFNPRSLLSLSKNLGLFGLVDFVSGGAFGRGSIFALSLSPYVLSSITVQLLCNAKDGKGKSESDLIRNRGRLVRLLVLPLSFIQGSLLVWRSSDVWLMSDLRIEQLYLFFVSVVSIMSGSVFMIWLSEIVGMCGLGNGVSILMCASILVEVVPGLKSMGIMYRAGAFSDSMLLAILFGLFLVVAIVVAVEGSSRTIQIVHSRRGANSFSTVNKIPMKVNIVGVMPAVFASTALSLPSYALGIQSGPTNSVLYSLYTNPIVFYALELILISTFTALYWPFAFDVVKLADNMKYSGAVISTVRPGKATADYLSEIAFRMAIFSGTYLGFISVFVDFFRAKFSIPIVLGGTSILIVVGVALEMLSNIQLAILSSRYDSMLNKVAR